VRRRRNCDVGSRTRVAYWFRRRLETNLPDAIAPVTRHGDAARRVV